MSEITNGKADELIDLYAENEKLKLELGIANAILSTLKNNGFESEIKYIDHKIRNTIKNHKNG